MTEYVIWGIAPGDPDEQILLTTHGGKPITSQATADALAIVLTTRHHCRECRIQAIDGSLPDFAATLNTDATP